MMEEWLGGAHRGDAGEGCSNGRSQYHVRIAVGTLSPCYAHILTLGSQWAHSHLVGACIVAHGISVHGPGHGGTLSPGAGDGVELVRIVGDRAGDVLGSRVVEEAPDNEDAVAGSDSREVGDLIDCVMGTGGVVVRQVAMAVRWSGVATAC